jgi:hypothetical protein
MRRLALSLTLLLPLAAAAADPPPGASTGRETTPVSPAAAPAADAWKLELREAVLLAVQNSLDVQILRFDPRIAEADLLSAWGAYDPAIFGEGGIASTDVPTASALFLTPIQKTRIIDGEAGLRGRIPWLGGSYSVSYAGSETETNLNVATLSPQYTADFVARLQFPLLRGLFWSPEWTLVRTSRLGVGVASDQFA